MRGGDLALQDLQGEDPMPCGIDQERLRTRFAHKACDLQGGLHLLAAPAGHDVLPLAEQETAPAPHAKPEA